MANLGGPSAEAPRTLTNAFFIESFSISGGSLPSSICQPPPSVDVVVDVVGKSNVVDEVVDVGKSNWLFQILPSVEDVLGQTGK